MVGIIMIAENDGGVSAMPNQPAMPMAPTMEKIMMMKVLMVPEKPLTQKYSTTTNSSSISGNRVDMSYWLASGKAWFIMMIPVSLTSISENSALNSLRNWRTKSTTSGFSVIGSTPGSSMVILTPVTWAFGDISLLIKTGSSSAISRMRIKSSSVKFRGS